MKIQLIITTLISASIFGCASSETTRNNTADLSMEVTNKSVTMYYDSIFNKIDAIEKAHEINIDTSISVGTFPDTLELRLLHMNDFATKLCYSIFEEDGLSERFASYYFDDNGNLIGNKVTIETTEYYEVFYQKKSVIVYQKNDEGAISINSIDTVGIYSKLAIAAYEVASFMKFFPQIKYSNVYTSLKSIPILRTFGHADLKSKPTINSKTIGRLQDNTHLVYLNATSENDTINDQTWIWYNVMTDNKTIGWVFGYPKNIGLLTDENWE